MSSYHPIAQLSPFEGTYDRSTWQKIVGVRTENGGWLLETECMLAVRVGPEVLKRDAYIEVAELGGIEGVRRIIRGDT